MKKKYMVILITLSIFLGFIIFVTQIRLQREINDPNYSYSYDVGVYKTNELVWDYHYFEYEALIDEMVWFDVSYHVSTDGIITIYLLDSENFAKFQNKETFLYVDIYANTHEGNTWLLWAKDGIFYVVFDNENPIVPITLSYDLDINIYKADEPHITECLTILIFCYVAIISSIIIGIIFSIKTRKQKNPKENVIIREKEPNVVYCPNCGTENIDITSDYCSKCGSKLEK